MKQVGQLPAAEWVCSLSSLTFYLELSFTGQEKRRRHNETHIVKPAMMMWYFNLVRVYGNISQSKFWLTQIWSYAWVHPSFPMSRPFLVLIRLHLLGCIDGKSFSNQETNGNLEVFPHNTATSNLKIAWELWGWAGGHGRERRNQKKCFEVEKYFNKPIVSVAGQPQKPGQELRRRSPQELPIATSPFRTHRETEAQKWHRDCAESHTGIAEWLTWMVGLLLASQKVTRFCLHCLFY